MDAVRKVSCTGLAIVLAVFVSIGAVRPAFASGSSAYATGKTGSAVATQSAGDSQDIVLGVFTESTESWTNNVYASYDGEVMYRIASTFASAQDTPYYQGHYAQLCPSIMYHDGYFWSLSNWNRNDDDKFWPMISYSKDLIHWTHPEGEGLITGTRGISVDRLPTVNGADCSTFDVVAPEWSKAANGDIYIVFTAGYYGEYHGQPMQDQMQAYTVKVTELSARDGNPDGSSGYLWPRNLTFRADTAKKLSFSDYRDADYIDGQIFADNGTDYLLIKRKGLWNELYRTSDITNPNGWELVNNEVTSGYEGVSVTKLNGKYLLYSDGVLGTKPLGVCMVSSNNLTKQGNWGELKSPLYLNEGNERLTARHGTAITLKAGTAEWQIAKNLLDAQNRKVKSGALYRVWNEWTTEHLFTGDALEAGTLSLIGWTYEGIEWYAPETSDVPVYRLYNPWSGDHLFTTKEDEYEELGGIGWDQEGIVFYSAGEDGVPVYRGYNPYVTVGTHHFTTNKGEMENMVSVGWEDEGVVLHGTK